MTITADAPPHSADVPSKRGQRRRAAPARTPLAQVVRASPMMLGALALWLIFYALVLSPLQEHHDQGVLYAQLRQNLAEQTAPVSGVIPAGRPIAIINAPAAGITREVVLEGTTSANLMSGPGHVRSTPLPGQTGQSWIMGRSTLFGGPFGRIDSLRPGASISVTTGQGTASYTVQQTVHAGQNAPAMTGSGQLVLVTATSGGWRSGWAPSNALYVYASLTSKPFGTDAGEVAAVPTTEYAMKGDSSALFELVLWLPLLLAAMLALLWAFVRWGRWQAWIVGVPTLLALLWVVSQTLVRLLPNLL